MKKEGKFQADATARLYQTAHPSSALRMQDKEKLKQEYAVAQCTFKPTLYSGEEQLVIDIRNIDLKIRDENKLDYATLLFNLLLTDESIHPSIHPSDKQ